MKRLRIAAMVGASLIPASVSWAHADQPPAMHRLEVREETLARQADAATQLARQQARAAYRLARRRQLGFVAAPEARLDDARALDRALFTVRRSASENQVLRDELERVRSERAALAVALARPADAGDPAGGGARPRFLRPVKGAIVGRAGVRKDPGTGVEVRHDGLQILARLNEPVHAPAAGIVSRVELLPQGGIAVMTVHEGGWKSVLTGLRDVSVAVGDTVDAGAPLGLAGRNLDGAAVVAIELWHGRRAVDPRPLLLRRPHRGVP